MRVKTEDATALQAASKAGDCKPHPAENSSTGRRFCIRTRESWRLATRWYFPNALASPDLCQTHYGRPPVQIRSRTAIAEHPSRLVQRFTGGLSTLRVAMRACFYMSLRRKVGRMITCTRVHYLVLPATRSVGRVLGNIPKIVAQETKFSRL